VAAPQHDETEAFEASRSQPKRNLMKALLEHPREILIVVGLTMGGTVAFYTYTTYMQKFLANTVGFSRDDATLVSAASLFLYMLLQPLVGAFSDKVGRRPVLIAFGILGTLCTVPVLTTLSHTKDGWAAFLLIMAALVIVSFYTSINAVVKAELFPTHIRALGVGLPYALTVSLFGGTAEYVALWFKDQGHEPWFYWYVTGCIAVSFLVYTTMRDTKHRSRMEP
jgi:MHS family alpha-ketoglutarate permease-like MFS transporter